MQLFTLPCRHFPCFREHLHPQQLRERKARFRPRGRRPGLGKQTFAESPLQDVQKQDPEIAESSSTSGLAIACLSVASLRSCHACSAYLGLLVNIDFSEVCWFQGLGLANEPTGARRVRSMGYLPCCRFWS